MEKDIQFIDFSQNVCSRGKFLGADKFSINYNPENFGKSGIKATYITFGKDNTELLSQFKFCRLAVSNICNKVFLVFNNEKGLYARSSGRNNNIIVNNKGLVEWLVNRYNLDKSKKRHIMKISSDMSNVADMVTFEILGVAED